MKHFITSILVFVVFTAQSQKNTLLERTFWKSNPTIEKVEAEIKAGNSPSELNSNAFDATTLAINEGVSNDVVQFLLSQKGNSVNKITHDERTYIFWAANKGNTEVMNYLIKKGAKVNLLDNKGYSPLNFAASNAQPNTEVYDILIKAGINLKKDLNLDGANALLLAGPNDNDMSLINYFISKGLDNKSTDSNGNTLFNYVAKSGNIDHLNDLLKRGVTFNDNALLMASQGLRNKTNTVQLYNYLLGLKIKPNVIGKNGENVLHGIARKDSNIDAILFFLSKGVSPEQPNEDGTTPFMIAAKYNKSPEVVNFLMSKVRNINTVNKKGVSALAMAVQNNTPEIVLALLNNGADTKLTNADGLNLAYYLIESFDKTNKEDFEAKYKVLKQSGFDITVPQKNGNTLYHLAVAKNDLNLIQMIKPYGIDVNAQNSEGMTALHKAAMVAKDTEILNYLLNIGADKTVRTNYKESAFDLASENEYLSKNKVNLDFLK